MSWFHRLLGIPSSAAPVEPWVERLHGIDPDETKAAAAGPYETGANPPAPMPFSHSSVRSAPITTPLPALDLQNVETIKQPCLVVIYNQRYEFVGSHQITGSQRTRFEAQLTGGMTVTVGERTVNVISWEDKADGAEGYYKLWIFDPEREPKAGKGRLRGRRFNSWQDFRRAHNS